MFIVGLCGFAGSGKTTIANYLIERYGFERFSFAGPVKDVAATVFGWPRARLEGVTTEDRAWREEADPEWSAVMGYPFTRRWGLQMIGNGMRELVHSNIWVTLAKKEMAKRPASSKLVLDDVRYFNERNMLREMGGRLYTVHRVGDRGIIFPSREHTRLWNEATDDQILSTEITPLHRSEWDWLRDLRVESDPIIGNPGVDLNALKKTVDDLFERDIMDHDLQHTPSN